MSSLRLIGLAIGIIGLAATFLIYRGPKWNRANFIWLSLFNLALIVVTINPAVVNFLQELLSLQQNQRGRLIALLIFSNLFLMFFSFYAHSKTEKLRLQFDKLVRHLGVETVQQAELLLDRIKPITILIPAYNEASNLDELLPLIPAQIGQQPVGVLVVDDGSDDQTRQVTEAHGHLVVSSRINRGGGAALRLGYDILQKAGAKICVTMDADGQHQPGEIERLVDPILQRQYDFVIGSRILGDREKDSIFRLMGVYVFSKLVSSLLGEKITDPSSGFRAFRLEVVNASHLLEDQYHTSELIIETVKRGLKVGEQPITILKRKHGQSKKGKNWIYGFHFAKTIIKTWWR